MYSNRMSGWALSHSQTSVSNRFPLTTTIILTCPVKEARTERIARFNKSAFSLTAIVGIIVLTKGRLSVILIFLLLELLFPKNYLYSNAYHALLRRKKNNALSSR